jgi:lipopolysaccharide/colanic/teichoic acid biosynthesis glycosyltransferase
MLLTSYWPMNGVGVYASRERNAYWPLKRFLDFALAAVGVVVLSPVFCLVAVAVALGSRGPIFYAQERVGLNRRRSRNRLPARGVERRRENGLGRPFKIYKFRSMVTDAERKTGPVWAAPRDPRITRVGTVLRGTHLDELPQLVNVLRGEMSLIGPRPERPAFVRQLAQVIPAYVERCSALPGITGLAQVHCCYDSSTDTVSRKVAYDLYYVRHGSLLLDLKILAATLVVVSRGERGPERPRVALQERAKLGAERSR